MHTQIRTLPTPANTSVLDADWLRQLCLEAGADDVGFVELERPALAEERPHIERAFPRTRSLISFVLRMNRDNVRSPARSVANAEFHHAGDEVNGVEPIVGPDHAENPPARQPQMAARVRTVLPFLSPLDSAQFSQTGDCSPDAGKS
jgi:hypothetical protein